MRTATPTSFTVDCAQAGPGDVQIALQNEKGQDVPFKINDNRDGKASVRVRVRPIDQGIMDDLVIERVVL